MEQTPAHAGSSLSDFSTMKMEAIRSSETSVHMTPHRRRLHSSKIFLIIDLCNSLHAVNMKAERMRCTV
jgi:hypothetical protein